MIRDILDRPTRTLGDMLPCCAGGALFITVAVLHALVAIPQAYALLAGTGFMVMPIFLCTLSVMLVISWLAPAPPEPVRDIVGDGMMADLMQMALTGMALIALPFTPLIAGWGQIGLSDTVLYRVDPSLCVIAPCAGLLLLLLTLPTILLLGRIWKGNKANNVTATKS